MLHRLSPSRATTPPCAHSAPGVGRSICDLPAFFGGDDFLVRGRARVVAPPQSGEGDVRRILSILLRGRSGGPSLKELVQCASLSRSPRPLSFAVWYTPGTRTQPAPLRTTRSRTAR